jgi:hypothetical protein
VLDEHTYAHRALLVENVLGGLLTEGRLEVAQ